MAGPFPLATLGCTIGPGGITSPSFADIYASLQASMQSIYGSDVVIEPSSQDGQMLAIFAQGQYDSNQATIAAYNNFSPATAQGNGLSSIVKINGLKRQKSSSSTANITITGAAGTVVINGLVGDNQSLGTQWALPPSVVIPVSGTITTTATCTKTGNVSAQAGTLVNIVNPQAGWQTATNASPAVPGAPVEVDSALRLRQASSVALPAKSVVGGILGQVANVPGVARLQIYENDTDAVNAIGQARHSVWVVVQGGAASAIALAIEQTKPPGTTTVGATSVVVQDPAGVPVTINFDALALTTIDVVVTGTALAGYVSSTAALVQSAVAAYLNSLVIGGKVQWSKLWAPADLSGSAAVSGTGLSQAALDAISATFDLTALTLAIHGNAQGVADVTIAANAAASAGTVTVTIA